MPGPVTTDVLRFAVVRPAHSTGVIRIDSAELAGEKPAVFGAPAAPLEESVALLKKAQGIAEKARKDDAIQKGIKGLVLMRTQVLLNAPKTIAETKSEIEKALRVYAPDLKVNRDLV